MTKVKEKLKKMPLKKAESDRTKKERVIRDIVCYAVVAYVAVLSILFVNAQVKLANASSDLANAFINQATQQENITLSMR